ncbi:Uncharacterised protein g4866 [Pycnogonum litorale]
MEPSSQDSKEKPVEDFDEILVKTSQFGKYQKIQIYVVCLFLSIPGPIALFIQPFITSTPDHWCNVPELRDLNITTEEIKNISIPYENVGSVMKRSNCKMYDIDYRKISLKDVNFTVDRSSWPVTDCKHGWKYDTSVYESTIVTQWDLVCDKDLYPTVINSIAGIGLMLGVMILGYVSDRFGRKKAYFICLVIHIVAGIGEGLAPDMYTFTFFRFVVLISVQAFNLLFVITVELVGPKYRGAISMIICVFYVVGLVLLTLFAFLIRNWRTLILVTSIPFVVLLPFWWITPESARWLMAQGRREEAEKILEKISQVNKKPLPVIDYDKLSQKKNVAAESISPITILKYPNMRKKTLLLLVIRFTNALVYFGLNVFVDVFGSNIYLSFLLSSCIEIPADISIWLIIDRWGRRWPLCIYMIICGVSSMCTLILPEGNWTSFLVLYLISKLCITGSFLVVFPLTAELFPTSMRSTGLATSAIFGPISAIILPFILYLGKNYLKLPMIILGALSILAGISTLMLPETLNYPLPQTIEEAEEFGKDYTLKDYLRCGSMVLDSDKDEEIQMKAVNESNGSSPKILKIM